MKTFSELAQIIPTLDRALKLSPILLLLDEPTLGLSPNFVDAMLEKIKEINREGTTVLMVEQNVDAAFRCTKLLIIMANGQISFKGSTAEIKRKSVLASVF